ncbi:MAG: hypothetical protein ACREBV_00970, partial [Candidatus Zixiibacteriota bacterium]
DLYSLSRYFERRKETDKIETIYYRIKEEESGLSPEAALHYAKNLKRNRKFAVSVEIWESIVKEKSGASFRAGIELAKYYEHQLADFGRALEFTKIARNCAAINSREELDLKKRVQRLNRKLNASADN